MLLLLLPGTQASSSAQNIRGGERPNIIVVVTDDQRADALGAYGNEVIRTPHLDSLAHDGHLFSNAFVTTSICAPNRASLLLGEMASRHGIWDFGQELSPEQLDRSYLGQLKEAGYRIGFVGKWGVGQPPDDFFDFDGAFAGQGHYWVEESGRRRHLTSVLASQAARFIEETSDTDAPFCLAVSFKAAHVQDSYDVTSDPFPADTSLDHLYEEHAVPRPSTADEQYFEQLPPFLQNSENRLRWAVRFWGPARYQQSVKDYYRLISGVDRAVGRIVRTLRDERVAENTVVLFTSDNGFFLGEHGLAGKWLPHEPSIRVPLIVYDPRLPDAERHAEMALSIDVAPTVLELAGLASHDAMQGRSLVPLLRGQEGHWRSRFLYEHLFEHPRIPKTEAVRTRRWKYIRYVGRTPTYEQLYDLQHDPLETNNLAGHPAYQEVLGDLRRQWKQRRTDLRSRR